MPPLQPNPITRRTFLHRAIGGAAALALPSACGSEGGGGTEHTDVAILGAGLAGLTAARDLAAAGIASIVLEARDRVGGRTLNHDLGGGRVIELGGQWVGPITGPVTQSRVLALAREVGVGTFKTFGAGETLDERHGAISRYSALPPATAAAYAEAARAIGVLDQLAAAIPPEAPWTARDAASLDARTVESWLLENVALPDARDLLRLAVEGVFAATTGEISFLDLLAGTRGSGSFLVEISTEGGAQDSRFVGGSQALSLRLAERLAGSVRLGRAVTRIDQESEWVTLSGAGFAVRAQRAIVTLPPVLAGRIEYAPALPGLRDGLGQAMPMGHTVKVQCVYDEPFWRADGLNGQVTSDTGPVKTTFDNSPPEGSPGVLLGFVAGADAGRFGELPLEERRATVVAAFTRLFGHRAARPVDYVDKVWLEDPWSRGSYGYFPPGSLTKYGPALAEPVGRLHWAGSESSLEWPGYMEGAVRSGERAAREVIAAL